MKGQKMANKIPEDVQPHHVSRKMQIKTTMIYLLHHDRLGQIVAVNTQESYTNKILYLTHTSYPLQVNWETYSSQSLMFPRSHRSHFLNVAGLFSRRRIREVSALTINCSSLEEAHLFMIHCSVQVTELTQPRGVRKCNSSLYVLRKGDI